MQQLGLSQKPFEKLDQQARFLSGICANAEPKPNDIGVKGFAAYPNRKTLSEASAAANNACCATANKQSRKELSTLEST